LAADKNVTVNIPRLFGKTIGDSYADSFLTPYCTKAPADALEELASSQELCQGKVTNVRLAAEHGFNLPGWVPTLEMLYLRS